MRILYVNKVSPKFSGGAEIRLKEIGRRFVRKGHEIHIICGKTELNLPSYEIFEGMHIHYVNTIPKLFFKFRKLSFYLSRYLFYILNFRLVYKIAKKVDIIVDDIAPSCSSAYIVGKILNKPVYATFHEYNGLTLFKFKDPFTAFLSVLNEYLLKVFNFEKIITVSENSKKNMVEFGIPKEKIVVVPNGIDFSKYQIPKILKEKNSIVIVGRLAKQKGHIYLIKAMHKVIQQVPDAKLYIIGDGYLRNELESYVKNSELEKNIIFMGKVSEEEKIERLHKSELFVLPSLHEGFGIVLLEAMACGLPIIASDLPVFRELMDEQNGYFVEKANSKEFAKKIVELLRDVEKRDRIGRYNQEYVKRFDWDKVAEMEEEVLMI